jgi:hypothetical protein
MNESYVLKRNKTVFETAEFPQIAADEKIGIIFEGDIESTLLVIIAKKLYGVDRVVFINDRLIAFDGTLSTSKDENKLDIVKKTFEQGVKRLGGIHTLTVDSKIYKKNRNATRAFTKLLVEKYQGKLKFVLSGYNKIHEQSLSMLRACGWDRGALTNGELKSWIEKNADLYPELFEYVCEQNGKIFGVNKYISFEQIEADFNLCVRPFRNLTTSDVIDLYEQLGAKTELYESSSCDVDLGNCGICSDCHKRKLAFRNSSVADLTKYTFN